MRRVAPEHWRDDWYVGVFYLIGIVVGVMTLWYPALGLLTPFPFALALVLDFRHNGTGTDSE